LFSGDNREVNWRDGDISFSFHVYLLQCCVAVRRLVVLT
jgi:hypothetical protein